MLVAALLLVFAYLPGHLLGGVLVRKGDGWGEVVMLRLAASAAILAPLLAGLALAGLFTVPVVLGSLGACAGFLLLVLRRGEGFRGRVTGWDAALLGLVGGSFALYARPVEYVINSRDPGVYTLVAERLARTGELLWRDPLIGAVAPFHELASGTKYPGFYVSGENLIVPQFFPGPFALLGFGNLAGGLWGSLYVVPVLGALAVGMAFLLGSELFGRRAGLIGAVLLAASYAEVWWARHPSSEVIAQLFVLSGLWLAVRFVRGGGAATGIVAGLLLGAAMLVRVDAFLAALALPVLAGYDLFVRRPFRRWLYPGVPLVLAALVALVYLNTVAGRYLNLIYDNHHLNDALKMAPYTVGVAAVVAAALWALRRRYGEQLGAWMQLGGARLAVPCALVVAGVALWGYFVLPVPWETLPDGARDYDAYREQILIRLTWFVTPPVAALALVGLVLAARRPDAARVILLGAVLSFGFLYALVPNVAPDLPWATRRFVPAVFPGLALLAGFAIVEAGRGLARVRGPRAGLAVSGALAVLACAWTVHSAAPILSFRELGGAVASLDGVERRIPASRVLFVEVPEGADNSASTFEYLYGRPVLPYSRESFRKDVDDLREAGLLEGAAYMTVDGGPAPLISGLSFQEVAETEISLPRLAPVEKEPPRIKETMNVTYRVFSVHETERFSSRAEG